MSPPILLRPDAVFDGERHHRWNVLVEDGRIRAAGSGIAAPDGARTIELAGATLLPGLIDLHTHLLLHPYDERPWTDQVLRDSESFRVARAVVAARRTLEAGFTTVRDLGTEGAGEADAGLRRAVAEGVIPGPRIFCVTRAIVARGSYGPTGFHSGCCVPQGAEEVDGPESIARVTRSQIARGADWVKVYADYRYGPAGEARPAFAADELALIVRIAHDAGVPVAAHATTAEGMRRAALAGVQTVEHGNDGTPEVFALLAERGVVYVPTLAAYEALEALRGQDSEHPAVVAKRDAFAAARASGVTIANGSDVGRLRARAQRARDRAAGRARSHARRGAARRDRHRRARARPRRPGHDPRRRARRSGGGRGRSAARDRRFAGRAARPHRRRRLPAVGRSRSLSYHIVTDTSRNPRPLSKESRVVVQPERRQKAGALKRARAAVAALLLAASFVASGVALPAPAAPRTGAEAHPARRPRRAGARRAAAPRRHGAPQHHDRLGRAAATSTSRCTT